MPLRIRRLQEQTWQYFGPDLYKGVAIKDLVTLAGGGTTIKAIATDGYESTFTAEEVNGVVKVYDKEIGRRDNRIRRNRDDDSGILLKRRPALVGQTGTANSFCQRRTRPGYRQQEVVQPV